MNKNTFYILLVDDRPENILSLEEALWSENRVFFKANSGNEALKTVLRHPEIGLILLDVQMPGIDGFEVAQILKSNLKTREISIIFVTAISKEHHYVIQGFEQGAVDYLQKPLDLEVLQAKVRVFEQLYFYQARLRDARERAESVNRQLEKFIYTVAHDIKSPLSGMIALLSVLKEDAAIQGNERNIKYMSHLDKAAAHLSGMVSGILAYSRQSLEEQKEELVDVGELVQDIWQLLFPPEHIRLETSPDLPVLPAKKLKLMQVFQNLLSNAVKYLDKDTGLVQVGCREKDYFYEFFVSDNGQGMEEAHQEEMLGLFRRGSNVATGEESTGVGLNILKVLVEEQGGAIRIESKKGAGTTVYFDWKKPAD